MFWLLSFVSSATQGGLASVKVTTLAGGAGDDSCRLAGHRDGLASLALFNLPARVQAVKKRLYVLDNHNGCIRSFPLGQPPADTYVRSDTGCGSNSTLACVNPPIIYNDPNLLPIKIPCRSHLLAFPLRSADEWATSDRVQVRRTKLF